MRLWCRNLSSSSGLWCGPAHPALHSFCLSVEQSVSQHSDPGLRREKNNKQKKEIINTTEIFKTMASRVKWIYFSPDLSFQASRSLLWSDCPQQPGCRHSRLIFLQGQDSGLQPRNYGGVRWTCAVSSLSRLDPWNRKRETGRLHVHLN